MLLAYAPIVSLIGDYYEAGSIIASRIAHAIDSTLPVARWRSDDLLKLAGQLLDARATAIDWLGVGIGFLAGLMLALLTYRAGAIVAQLRRNAARAVV